jgi:diguanylate cyclase (GGDEF)-like protein
MKQEPAETHADLEEAERDAVHQPGPTRSLRQRYFALLWRARLSVVAFWTAMLFFLAWAIPWIPSGLSVQDYTREVVATFILAGACASLGVIALLLRRHAQKTQEALIAWSTVYDDTTGLHNRRYFYDWLSIECDRAKVHGTSFAVMLLRLEGMDSRRGVSAKGLESDLLRAAADELSKATRSTDVAALLGANQLGVILGRVDDNLAEEAAARLVRSVQGALTPQAALGVRFGLSSYGTNARNPSSLLRAAQRDMKRRARKPEGQEKSPRAA